MVKTRNAEPVTSALAEGFASISSAYDTGDLDPHDLYRERREQSPITDGDLLAQFGVPSQADFTGCGRDVQTVYRYADVSRILRDPETFSSSLLMEGFATFLGEDSVLSGMDGVQHRQLRAIMQPAFAPAQMKHWAQVIGHTLREDFIDPMLPLGGADLVSSFAVPFPVRIVYEVLGFPKDPEATERFATLALRILGGFQSDPDKAQAAMEAAFAATAQLYDLILPIVAERRSAGATGNDLMAVLLRAEVDGEPLDDDRIARLIRMMIVPATETTTRAFGNLLVHLLKRPDLLERVRADRSLVSRVIAESMRYDTVTGFLARLVTKDAEVAGVTVPAGTALSLAVGSANRDSDMFPDGDTFDINRPLRPAITFGMGPHMCIGMPIAKIELESALNVVLDAMPRLRFDPAHPEAEIRGPQLRGPESLHVLWD